MSKSTVPVKSLQDIIASGNLEEVQTYLNKNPETDLNALNAEQESALSKALRVGKYDIAKYLLTLEGVDVTLKTGKLNETYLHILAGNDSEGPILIDQIVKLAGKEKGKLLNAQDIGGNTPFHAAAIAYNSNGISVLLNYEELNVNAQNKEGRTPLMEVTRKLAANEEYIKYTLETYESIMGSERFGAIDLNLVDNNKETALHHAARSGIGKIAADLVEKGADTKVRNKYGWTPYMTALGASKRETETVLGKFSTQQERSLAIKVDSEHKRTTPEILAAATIYENPEKHRGKIEAIYQELYQYPEFRATMDLAAAQAIGERGKTGDEFRIFIADGKNLETLTRYKILGGYNQKGVSFSAGGDMDSKDLAGALIHEMTHFAAHALNGLAKDNLTNAFPYTSSDKEAQNRYVGAVNVAVLSGNGFTAEEMDAYRTVITEGKDGYNDNQQLEEHIARVPQALYLYGDATDRAVPELRTFYEGFNGQIKTMVGNHPNAKYLDNSSIEHNQAQYKKTDRTHALKILDEKAMEQLFIRNEITLSPTEKKDFLNAWKSEVVKKHDPLMMLDSSELRHMVLGIKQQKQERGALSYENFKNIFSSALTLVGISQETAHQTVEAIPHHSSSKGKKLKIELSKSLHSTVTGEEKDPVKDKIKSERIPELAKELGKALSKERVTYHKKETSQHTSIDLNPAKINRATQDGWQKFLENEAETNVGSKTKQ